MDDVVRRAMLKWPNVPAVFGWLALDQRGQWLIRGERIANPLVSEFIDRNYAGDEHGRWFFQNGPQRVFVALAYAPWVLRLDAHGELETHTGLAVKQVSAAGLDREGIVVLLTEHGAGVVDDRHVEAFSGRFTDPSGAPPSEEMLAESLDTLHAAAAPLLRLSYGATSLPLQPLEAEQVPQRFGFTRDPQPLPNERTAS